jgi:hypothetical protein
MRELESHVEKFSKELSRSLDFSEIEAEGI